MDPLAGGGLYTARISPENFTRCWGISAATRRWRRSISLLRQAGWLIATSWWGQGSREDRVVPLLLEMGERYGIQVAFHIENYGGRTAEGLVRDIQYLYARYGDQPAFFRSSAASRWCPDERPKGLFFLWASRYPDPDQPPVEAEYWREALDAVHALPQGGLVMADETLGEWVDGGHFDGLYNYAVLEPDEAQAYQWARMIPPGTWYVPGINPGFSAVRIGYNPDTYVARSDGEAYQQRWQAALEVGVQPDLVAITSFNEWHEGTQIEPAEAGAENGRGYVYEDYGSLPPDGYLALTRRWVERFEASTWPETPRVRFRLVTSSDWTTLGMLEGADWMRPDLVSVSDGAEYAGAEGARYLLTQPFDDAQRGERVEMVLDVLLSDLDADGELVLEIERGHLGATWLEVYTFTGEEPELAARYVWDGIAPGERNARQFRLPVPRCCAKISGAAGTLPTQLFLGWRWRGGRLDLLLWMEVASRRRHDRLAPGGTDRFTTVRDDR